MHANPLWYRGVCHLLCAHCVHTPDLDGVSAVQSDLRCGARNGVALSGTIAVLGCPGWEAVFVFRDTSNQGAGDEWVQSAVLRASDYRDVRVAGVCAVLAPLPTPLFDPPHCPHPCLTRPTARKLVWPSVLVLP